MRKRIIVQDSKNLTMVYWLKQESPAREFPKALRHEASLQRYLVLFPMQQNEKMQNRRFFERHPGKCQLWKWIASQGLIFVSLKKKKK